MYVSALSVVYMYTMHVACSGGGQRRALGPLNWTVTDGCEPPYIWWDWNLGPLQKQ